MLHFFHPTNIRKTEAKEDRLIASFVLFGKGFNHLSIMKKCLFIILALFVMVSCEKGEFLPEDNFAEETGSSFGVAEPDIENAITLYTVDGDDIRLLRDYRVPNRLKAYQNDRGRHDEIWDFVTRVIPLEARGNIAEFIIFYGNQETDGFVEPINPDDLSRWRFGLAIDAAEDLTRIDFSNYFTHLVLHEYAHVMTLNNGQINVGGSEESCPQFFTGEGCSKPGSYINRFYELGWADIYEDHNFNQPERTYDRYPDRFVSDYAATNPGEDIAEVFGYFVTQGQRPTGESIADKKIQLLYEFPELVALRETIRGNADPNGLQPGSFGKMKSLRALSR